MAHELEHPFPWHTHGLDLRGIPALECVCGGNVFHAVVWFCEDRTIGGYLLDGMCAHCGSLLTLPTEIDEVIEDA